MVLRTWLFCLMSIVPSFAAASPFDDARTAARQGHYGDVVRILSGALKDTKLDRSGKAKAYANRGVALSLMGDYGKAKRDLRRAVDMEPDNGLALNQLGLLAQRVDGDDAEAARWYGKAADAGYAPAEVNLGKLYLQGSGVSRDEKKARALFQAAVDKKYAMAYTPLARMYLEGKGWFHQPRLAVELLRQGAAAGDVVAHYYLGQAYMRGEGVHRDAAEAARQFRQAALDGHAPAQDRLGDLYRTGSGVGRNYVEAARWYRLAVDQGNLDATDHLALLLATCPVTTVCNGDAALTLARRATRRHPVPAFMDTLAAAYARTGQFDLAIRTIKKVLAALPPKSPERAGFEAHLGRYQKGEPRQL